MTDTITLPRAVFRKWRNALIEMWVTADTGSRLEIEHILATLAAALAEPDAKREPVAFAKNGNLFWCGDASQMRGVDIDLYPAPPQPDAKREPATEEVIEAKFEKSFYVHPEALDDFAEGWCEAERFHGIRKEDKP
jgi:hypothetical protein